MCPPCILKFDIFLCILSPLFSTVCLLSFILSFNFFGGWGGWETSFRNKSRVPSFHSSFPSSSCLPSFLSVCLSLSLFLSSSLSFSLPPFPSIFLPPSFPSSLLSLPPSFFPPSFCLSYFFNSLLLFYEMNIIPNLTKDTILLVLYVNLFFTS